MKGLATYKERNNKWKYKEKKIPKKGTMRFDLINQSQQIWKKEIRKDLVDKSSIKQKEKERLGRQVFLNWVKLDILDLAQLECLIG